MKDHLYSQPLSLSAKLYHSIDYFFVLGTYIFWIVNYHQNDSYLLHPHGHWAKNRKSATSRVAVLEREQTEVALGYKLKQCHF